ncbi:MAG TPA: acyl-CoA dehydrogenase family protein [Tepidiformaceae bacterium]|nr:acyl-CoA dehydrogenase family protein [Tepidiformaceae bacterium]
MQVAPIPDLDPEINDTRLATANIVNRYIIPNEGNLANYRDPKTATLRHEIQDAVKKAGLWAPHLPKEYGGMGIGFMKHAYMNEILAWSPFSNSLFGVVAPDSGNQTILIKYGTDEQKKKWLEPSIRGEIRSCFSMTEPDAPGSDPYAIQTRAVRDGDDWVINGRKWFTSGAKGAAFAIVMCRTEEVDGAGGTREKMTQIIVPTDTPGFNIIRSVPVWGHDSNHCEIVYDNVRVPVTNQLGRTGTGHQAAQDRLGAGRVFHCMNCVGQMQRAFDLMVQRAIAREVHGGKLETKQFIQGFIADSYIDIQAARLMTIHAAKTIDNGVGDVRTDISAIKIFVPAALERVVDRAIQVHGAMGVSGDTPLAGMFTGARTLRIADGPDEVHRILISKIILKQYHDGMSWDFGV